MSSDHNHIISESRDTNSQSSKSSKNSSKSSSTSNPSKLQMQIPPVTLLSSESGLAKISSGSKDKVSLNDQNTTTVHNNESASNDNVNDVSDLNINETIKKVAINDPADIVGLKQDSVNVENEDSSVDKNNTYENRKSIIKYGKSPVSMNRKDKKNRLIGAQKNHSISFRDQITEKSDMLEDVVEIECWKEHNQMAQYQSKGTCCVIL